MRGFIAEKENIKIVIPQPTHSNVLAISPDNRSIAVGGMLGGGLYVADIFKGQATKLFDVWNIVGLKFSSDGKILYVGTKDRMVIVDANNDYRRKHTIKIDGELVAFDLGHDGNHLFLLVHEEKKDHAGKRLFLARVVIYETSTCKQMRSFDVEYGLLKTIAATGQCFAVIGLHQSVNIYNAATGEAHKKLLNQYPDEQNKYITTLSYNHNGRLLATRYNDGTINLLETTNYHLITSFQGHKAAVRSLTFSADNRYIATNEIGIWDLKTGNKRISLRGHYNNVFWSLFGKSFPLVHSVTFSPNGRFIAAAGGGYITVWNLSDKGGNDQR